MKVKDYEKYRWFFTSSGKLVVGGKSAEQNEKLVKKIMKGKERIMMHTSTPGSPFSVIISDIEKVAAEDLKEAAIFTACFSQQWKKRRKKVKVDIFTSKQIFKDEKMKKGTFGVAGKVESRSVEMKLYLTIQKGKLRAVPKAKEKLLVIEPGRIEKEKAAEKISKMLGFTKQEVLQALPAGGFKIKKLRK